MSEIIGTFRGTVTRQSKGKYGAARSVFAKFKGIKNELVYPFNGGRIMNPPKGTGFKMFTGDLMEFRTNDRYAQPEVYLLKTYLVESVEGNVVNIVRDGFKHKPFVGDRLGIAPEEIGGAMPNFFEITSVREGKVGEQDVWICGTNGFDASKGDVLVEVDITDRTMLVKQINAFADCDMDLVFDATDGDDEFEKAKYDYTPAVGGAYMYIHKMSPLPECVLKKNVSQFNGLFKLPTVG